LNFKCKDYGFECDYTLTDKKSLAAVEKLRRHFDSEHGIDYSVEAVTQIIMNRGHSLESIRQ